MNRQRSAALWFLLVCLFAAPALAQSGKSVVQLNFHGWLVERKSPFDFFARNKFALADRLRQIAKAATDSEVQALVLRFGAVSMSFAQVQELGQALTAFKKSGKKVYAHLEQAGNTAYLLASFADEVVMPPTGFLFINGLRLEALFLKDLLDKIGVTADFESTGKYKSAADSLTRKTMSPAQREALNALLDDVYGQFTTTLAKNRNSTVKRVKGLIDKALMMAPEAKSHKLVDRLAYWAEFKTELRRKYSGDWLGKYHQRKVKLPTSLFSLFAFLSNRPRTVSGPHIAVLYAVGPIYYGTGVEEWSGDQSISSFRFLQNLRTIENDKNVKALVLRIDSPGGSALASDVIWRALMRLKKRIPIIVSMGGVAASGGYYIAAPADLIVAQPTTITGSIGVIAGKLILKGLLDKIGVQSVVLTRGKSANMFGSNNRFSPAERKRFRHFIDQTYADFLSKVSSGRKLPLEQVKKLAQGRIWSGIQARKHKLVDHLGGLSLAVELARKRAKLPSPVRTVAYPKRKSFFEYFKKSMDPGMYLRKLALPFLPRVGREVLQLVAPLIHSFRNSPVQARMPLRIQIR